MASAVEWKNPTAPALPVPANVYNKWAHDQHNNVLRLYFRQLQAAIAESRKIQVELVADTEFNRRYTFMIY